MKALITSGGKGTRLRPLTHTQNKHLIPIANKPILHYAIETVIEAGISEIGIIVNADCDEVQTAIGDGSKWGVSITYIPQAEPLGLAHVVKIAEDFIQKEPFIFYLGDNMVVGGVQRFIEKFEQDNVNCYLTLAGVKDPERFGVPEIVDDRIVSVEEKPKKPKSKFAVAGIYIYDRHIFEAVNAIQPSDRGELEISDAHQYLIDHGYQIGYSEITGWWKDTGKPIDLLEANRLVLEHIKPKISGSINEKSIVAGNVIIEKGAKVINSNIRGPVVIGSDSVVENSYIGPFTAIQNNCTIRNSEIEYSIVLNDCEVIDIDIRIESSLLGTDVQIIKSEDKPSTHRFFIGDQSRVELV